MTEDEQPKQPPQSQPQQQSPWARGGAGLGHDDAGFQQRGAGQPDTGDTGAVQGGARAPGAGSAGARQGSTGHPADFDPSAAHGAGRSTPVADGASREGASPDSAYPDSALRPDSITLTPAAAGASSDFGSPAASQGAAGQPGTGREGAVQGGAGLPGHGLPGHGPQAWQGGFQRPDHVGPYGAAPDHTGSIPDPGGPGHPGASGPYYAPPGSVAEPPRRRGRGKVVAGVTALVLAVGGVAGGVGGYVGFQAAEEARPVTNALNQAPPAQQSVNAPEGSIEQVAQKVLPTVVQVQVSGGAGSGFTLSSDGLVLTNNHVVETAAAGGPMKVQLQDGRSFDARIVGRDPTSDLAVVKMEDVSGLPTAELGNSGDLRIGQEVVAVGSPFDLNGTVTSGIVSSLNRPVRAGGQQGGADTVLNAIQTDAAINPGNSGGPLVNMRGQVVGINSAIYSPNSSQSAQGGSVGIGFAIPIDQARRTAKELSETGKATQTVLGVQVGDVPEGGAVVRTVVGGGAAEAAGVKTGDVITKFGDRTVDSSDALVAAVRSRVPGEKVLLTIGEDRTVEVTLGSQPVEIR